MYSTRSTHIIRRIQYRIGKKFNILSGYCIAFFTKNWKKLSRSRQSTTALLCQGSVLNWSYLSFPWQCPGNIISCGVGQLDTERRHRWRWPALSFLSFSCPFFFLFFQLSSFQGDGDPPSPSTFFPLALFAWEEGSRPSLGSRGENSKAVKRK